MSVPLDAVTLAGLNTKLPPAPTSICGTQDKTSTITLGIGDVEEDVR